MGNEINTKIEELEKIKFIRWIAFISGIIEEILKRRRRTTLAIGAAITLLITILIAYFTITRAGEGGRCLYAHPQYGTWYRTK